MTGYAFRQYEQFETSPEAIETKEGGKDYHADEAVNFVLLYG